MCRRTRFRVADVVILRIFDLAIVLEIASKESSL